MDEDDEREEWEERRRDRDARKYDAEREAAGVRS